MKWTKRSQHVGSERTGLEPWRWTERSALALLGSVTFLATVAADVGLAVRAVVADVAHLGTVLALDVVHVARLSALLGHVAFVAIATTLLQRLLAASLARAKERVFFSGDSPSSVWTSLLLEDKLLKVFLLLKTASAAFDNSDDTVESDSKDVGLSATEDWLRRPSRAEDACVTSARV